jgi:hypothetical protein
MRRKEHWLARWAPFLTGIFLGVLFVAPVFAAPVGTHTALQLDSPVVRNYLLVALVMLVGLELALIARRQADKRARGRPGSAMAVENRHPHQSDWATLRSETLASGWLGSK